jgi:hypothetical protein
MSNDEKMTINERRKYLRLVRPRYRKAGRYRKGQLLNEMETITGLDRKTLIRLMSGSPPRHPGEREAVGRTVVLSCRWVCGDTSLPETAYLPTQTWIRRVIKRSTPTRCWAARSPGGQTPARTARRQGLLPRLALFASISLNTAVCLLPGNTCGARRQALV